MYGSSAANAANQDADNSQRTAFRRAEKQYKLYKSDAPTSRKSKKPVLNRCNLSDVVDFRLVLEEFETRGATPDGICRFECPGFERSVFCFEDRPGFYFIPSALTIEEQCHWIRESLMNFPQPPNRTNLTAIYGPITDLLDAVRNEKVLVGMESLAADLDNGLNIGKECVDQPNYVFSEGNCDAQIEGSTKAIAASMLLRKMRWSTLGLQFDWSKRNYDVSLPHNKIPESLSRLAKKMAVPAMPSGEEFQPEAAIVNYFGPSDMLGGHLDDMEVDWSKPIVSLSLGCKAIFLLGGKTREDAPKAMFLRSGDIVLMAGQARECFHGVPRTFTDNEHSEISTLLSRFSSEEDLCFADYLKNSRININIRQVN